MSKAEREMRKEEQEEQFERQMHGQNVGQAAAERDEQMSQYLDQLSASELSEGSKRLLKNLVGKDFVFANYSSDDIERLRFELQVMKMQYRDMHPGKECLVTGEDRAWINDDPTDTLEPLTPEETAVVDSFIEGIFSRMTRGEAGFQQEKINETVSVSEVRKDEKDNSGGGIFDRLG
jgi:hypothetical protein